MPPKAEKEPTNLPQTLTPENLLEDDLTEATRLGFLASLGNVPGIRPQTKDFLEAAFAKRFPRVSLARIKLVVAYFGTETTLRNPSLMQIAGVNSREPTRRRILRALRAIRESLPGNSRNRFPAEEILVLKGRQRPVTEATRQLLSTNGHSQSLETRAKISAARLRREVSLETRLKLSRANTDKTLPARTREKIGTTLRRNWRNQYQTSPSRGDGPPVRNPARQDVEAMGVVLIPAIKDNQFLEELITRKALTPAQATRLRAFYSGERRGPQPPLWLVYKCFSALSENR